ncbi:MAG TPA: tyrosine--tRNA ligase [Candidatus Paceibacterota bacterium]|nr:tyrosine--tRNA ligase [Candidatus Paceibacterota bacterium]
MTLVEELKARGLIELESAPADQILGSSRTVYMGMDPTADSLHVGHLVPILLMKRLGDAGHKLIFLIGGGTGMIGDPKEKGERVLLDEKTVTKNTKAISRQVKGILQKVSFRMVDNADWLMKVRLVPFLRDIGKHFTVNDLVKRDLIAKRLATPDESISYTEFTYSLLQAYDYLELNAKYNCDLQIGASDQWTNILSGVDLIRRRVGKEAYALTVPLITDSTGKKFGKSEGNAVWLDPQKTSPYQFYQFWMNLPDEGLEKYFKVYTLLSLPEIEAVLELHRQNPNERRAQEILGRLVTEIVHGPAAAAQAAAATDALFGGRSLEKLSRDERAVLIAEAPSLVVSKKELEAGYSLSGALVAAGLCSSKSDARRIIEGKGVSLNSFTIENPDQKLYPGDLKEGLALVRKGKRDVLVLVLK